MWKINEADAFDTISLHDCRITGVTESKEEITFAFQDGFWIGQHNVHNIHQKTLSTGESCLTLVGATFEKGDIEGEAFDWTTFCEKINVDQWEFECITQNHQNKQCTFVGWLCFDHTPYHYDCSVSFSIDQMVYRWNEIREDKPW